MLGSLLGLELPKTIKNEPYLPTLNHATVNSLHDLKSKCGQCANTDEIGAIIQTNKKLKEIEKSKENIKLGVPILHIL